MKADLFELLRDWAYPGRGICLGLSEHGDTALVAYWIMGRSENSRNRIFEAFPDGSGIRTAAADESRLTDPHLILYNAVRTLRDTTIVTNGDQTDTIYTYIQNNLFPGYGFEAALSTRLFEDDAPNFTPRISGIIDMRRGGYKLSIIKTCEGNEAAVERQTFDYPQPLAGDGHLLTTYRGSATPLLSYAGEPRRVGLHEASPEVFAEALWDALNPDNKVSLFVRGIRLADAAYRDVIINRYHRVRAV